MTITTVEPKKNGAPKKSKARLMIDFESLEAMYQWASNLKLQGMLPPESAVWEADSLDFMARKPGGVGRKHTYIVAADDSVRFGKKLQMKTQTVLVAE